jgi:hypothetical protein
VDFLDADTKKISGFYWDISTEYRFVGCSSGQTLGVWQDVFLDAVPKPE